ncbi:MAG: DsbA family protein [Thaumarchaeota archaeon]|nr:DsbA family protein [Nitrososphaerota archaeon]
MNLRRESTNKGIFYVAAAVVVAIFLLLTFTRSTTNQVSNLLKISPTDPVLGNTNAPVTIVEFGDFQRPTCGSWYGSPGSLIVQNLVLTGQAKLVWKDFDYYGPDSTLASKAARVAGEQGRFWDYYRALWSKQGNPNNGWASRPNLVQLAEDLGLDLTSFQQSLNSAKYDSIISDNFNLGKHLGVRGTPTLFILGPTGKSIMIVGDQPYSVFQQAINSVS